MESSKYPEIAALADVQKGFEFCRNYGILSDNYFEDCGKVKLGDKTIVDYLGFVERS